VTSAVIVVIAAVAIGYAAWYERRLSRAERGDREFARRHPVRASTDTHGPHWTRDPSPTRKQNAS
jgi:hypothetical protein